MWSSHPATDHANVTVTPTDRFGRPVSRRTLTRLIVVILLAVIAFVGWRFATRPKSGHLAATVSVLSVNPAAGSFSVRLAPPQPDGRPLGRVGPSARTGPTVGTIGATVPVRVAHSTAFYVCHGTPTASGTAPGGCSPASFAAVKVGNQVNVVGSVSNGTVTATRVQVF